MSIGLIVWALDDTPGDLAPADRLALIAIAERANDETRECWPGLAEIARRVGVSERSAQRILSRLVGRGLLERVSIGHKGRATVYRLPAKDDTAMTSFRVRKGRHLRPQRTSSEAAKDDTAMSPQPSGTLRNLHPRWGGVRDLTAAAAAEMMTDILGEPIPEHHAASAVRHVFDHANGGDVTDRAAYFRAAVTNNPDRFRPTPIPPPVAEVIEPRRPRRELDPVTAANLRQVLLQARRAST